MSDVPRHGEQARAVNRYQQVLERRVSAHESVPHVEPVMPIISQDVRVNERVETYRRGHQRNGAARENPVPTKEPRTHSQMGHHVRPREQRNEGGEVKYLAKVDRCDMGGTIADHYASVPRDEGNEHEAHR